MRFRLPTEYLKPTDSGSTICGWVKYGCIIVYTCFYFPSLQAQQPIPDRYRFVDIKLHSGTNYYSGEKSSEAFKNGYGALELRYGWHTRGDHEWEGAYNHPSYGIGWYTGYVGDVDQYGNPNALYGFMNFPLSDKNKRNVWMLEPALGLTYNLVPYDPVTNELNDAFGARMGVYFNLNFGGELKVTRELDLIYGFDFTHFSNGRTFTPNYGLNMAGFNIGTRYHFNRAQKQLDPSYRPQRIAEARPPVLKARKPTRIHAGGIQLYQAIGTVQNYIDAGTGKRYSTSSTVLDGYYHFSEMHGITLGMDLFNDQSLKDELAVPLYTTYQTTFFPGVHIGYDFMWWRFTARVQLGYLLTEAGRNMKTPFFTRPAIKFDFTKRFYAQVGLKTYKGATADWVEFGLGIKLLGR
jgi:hypothetical protein